MAATPMMKLYEIVDALDVVTAKIIEAEGEITPELEAELDALEGSFLEKAERIALRVRELTATAEAAKAEKDRLAAIQKANDRAAVKMKDYLRAMMGRTGQDRIMTARARIWIQKSGTPSIHYEGDPIDLPKRFVRHVPESFVLDKGALTDALRAGEEMPDGVRVEYTSFVRIS